MIGGFESVGREFHRIDGGEPRIAHDQKEGSQILGIATRLKDCRLEEALKAFGLLVTASLAVVIKVLVIKELTLVSRAGLEPATL